MSILAVYHPGDAALWRDLLASRLPELTVEVWRPGDGACAADYLAVWKPPAGMFAHFPKLKTVFTLGAGVDALLANPELPAGVAVVRLLDAGMAGQMTEYCLYGVLHFHRDFDLYARQQAQGEWRNLPPPDTAARKVGILGLGVMGGALAAALTALGFKVLGWGRSPKKIAGVASFHGRDGLTMMLRQTDILVCLLPLTPETDAILDRDAFAALPQGAVLINAGRGRLVDEDALLDALDSGHLRGALLDVFRTEPLPAGHRLWSHPKVIVTPHIAAETMPGPATAQIADNIRRLEAGLKPLGLVEPGRGY